MLHCVVMQRLAAYSFDACNLTYSNIRLLRDKLPTSGERLPMRKVVSIDPFRCRLWQLHDRLPEEITAESCTAEIQSFTEYGQMIPVLGRPLRGDPHHEIELIYGARRLFVARQINQPLL